jgi:hypothetical protein
MTPAVERSTYFFAQMARARTLVAFSSAEKQ